MRARYRSGAIVVAAAALLVGTIVWLILGQASVEHKLGGVKVAGPCRDLGVHAPECRRQSRLIVRACLIDTRCVHEVNHLIARGPQSGAVAENPGRPAPAAR